MPKILAPADEREAMKKVRLTDEQMARLLLEADDSSVAAVAKKHGASKPTIYPWRKRFGTLEPMDVKRLKTVEFKQSAAGVTVTVTFDGEPTHSEEQQRAGWQAILDNFSRHVSDKLASQ